MVSLSSSIGIKASMDTSSVERGTRKLESLLDGVGRKSKDLNVFFKRLSGTLSGIMKVGVGFGAGIVAGLTGALAASPHFKAFLLKMKGPFMKLSKFMGETFKPLFDSIAERAKVFIDIFTQNEGVRNFFDKWVTKIGEFINNIKEEDLNNFFTNASNLAGKTVEFGAKIVGGVWNTIFGEDGEGGIWKALNDTEDTIERTLNFKTSFDTKAWFALAGIAIATGHPWFAAALGAAGIISLSEDLQIRQRAAAGAPVSSVLGPFDGEYPETNVPHKGQFMHGIPGVGQTGGTNITLVIEDRTNNGVAPKVGSGTFTMDKT